MLKIERAITPSSEWWEEVVLGARNAYGSWEKSDSYWGWDDENKPKFIIGKNDLTLLSSLSNGGDDHGKYLRQLPVICRITAPHFWWPEMDQYKIGTVTNSCSKMHTLLNKPFEASDFTMESILTVASRDSIIEHLNYMRDLYFKYEDPYTKKQIWRGILEQLPLCYNQMRTWSANYQVLKRIYYARKDHKLPEWHQFCDWILTLPYTKELFHIEDNDEQTAST